MRHRKVLNLYDTDPGHEDLLVYLEGIEGSHRQQQALLQMAMIGFRVVSLHESGDEAYYGVRNPDALKTARKSTVSRSQPRLALKTKPVSTVPAGSMEQGVPAIPARQGGPEEREATSQESDPRVSISQAGDSEFFDDGDQEDEFNTLKILRAMDEGR